MCEREREKERERERERKGKEGMEEVEESVCMCVCLSVSVCVCVCVCVVIVKVIFGSPKKVPQKNGDRRTPTIGEDILVNQLGSNGVILKNKMYHSIS